MIDLFFQVLFRKGVNFISHIMKENGEIKLWDNLKNKFELEQRLYFK